MHVVRFKFSILNLCQHVDIIVWHVFATAAVVVVEDVPGLFWIKSLFRLFDISPPAAFCSEYLLRRNSKI